MPIATTDEQIALQDSIRLALSKGDEPWERLTRLGLFEMVTDGSIVDVCTAIEQVTDALTPGSITTTLLAGLLLKDTDETLLTALTSGELRVAVEVGELVLAPDDATHVLLKRGAIVPVEDVEITTLEALDLSRGLGRLRVLSEERAIPVRHYDDLLVVLAAAEASGVAGWCLRTASEYAKVREQFGRPIGSFQSIKHLCVTMLCRAEQAATAAWDAATAADAVLRRTGEQAISERSAQGGGAVESSVDGAAQAARDASVAESAQDRELELAAACAAAIAIDSAVENAKDCIQVLGGIGFTWEHEAHRYLRRAITLRQLLGGKGHWHRRIAQLTLDGVRRVHKGQTIEDVPDLSEIAALPKAEHRRALADAGLLMPANAEEALRIDEGMHRAGIEKPNLAIAAWAVPTILGHGTPAQQERFVQPSLRGDIVWCQLFSEPDAGSDLAALRTKAERVEGGWRLTGQKVWSSLAREAQWAICLARTDTTVPKHKGISYFLIKMDSPGIDIRPLREITGEAVFNEVFLDDVFVPEDCLVGKEGDGWRLARTTLANERVAMGRGSLLGEAVEKLISKVDEPSEQIGALVAEGYSVSLLDARRVDPSVRKLLGVKHRQHVAELTFELLGADSAYRTEESAEAIHQFLLTRCLSIAGGTTQILMSVAGERILGLPREPQ